MDPITLGLATTIIATPIFTGVYALGSMLHNYATTAVIGTVSFNEGVQLAPVATNIIESCPLNIMMDTTDKTARFVPSLANAVVAVKKVVEPVCEAVKINPPPLMIAPPPVAVPTIVPVPVMPTTSIDLMNMTNIKNINITTNTVLQNNTSTLPSYGKMFRVLVDGYRIADKIQNGDYLQAGAYGIGVALDYAMNETLSSTAGTYAESITGSSSTGLLVKAIFSMTTSIALRKVVPFFAEGIYSYFVPTPVVANQPIEKVAKIEENKPEIPKTAEIINIVANNMNNNANTNTNKPEVENILPNKIQEKKKPIQKIRRETSNERQFKRKLAELGVVERENMTAAPETIVYSDGSSSKKTLAPKKHRTTSKERQFERKLAALMIFSEQEQDQKELLNTKNNCDPVSDWDKKADKSELRDITNTIVSAHTTSIPTPAQRREARLAKKAASEKENLVQFISIDGKPRELAKKYFKDKNCHPDLNFTVSNTGDLKSISRTHCVENNESAPLLDGAKYVFDALANLLTITKTSNDELSPSRPVLTHAKNLDRARKESNEFWNQTAHRSYARMKKAEKHLNEIKADKKYSDASMIERAQSIFEDSRNVFEKESSFLTSIPKTVNF